MINPEESIVQIEPLSEEHYSQVAEWLSDPEINQWLYSEWRNCTITDRLIAFTAINKKNELFVIYYNNRPVGITSISQIDQIDSHAVLWYALGCKTLRGTGIASKAVCLTVEYASEELKLNTLEASVFKSNIASKKVLERNGFELAGCLRKGFRLNKDYVDRLIFDKILKL